MPAPVFVQSNTSASPTSTLTMTASYTGAQPVGNTNLVMVVYAGPGGVITGVTDTVGDVYTSLTEKHDTNYNETMSVFLCARINGAPAGNVVTVNFSPAQPSKTLQILEYSGVNSASPTDGISVTCSSDGDNQLTPTLPTTVTAHPFDTIVSFLNTSSVVTTTVPTGFTSRIAVSVNSAADGPAVSPGSYAPKWTLQGNRFNIVSGIYLTGPFFVNVPATLPANFVKSSSAILNGVISTTGSNPTVTYGFNWGSTLPYQNTVTLNGSAGTAPFSSQLTGLFPGNTYHFQTFATNLDGTGVSPDTTFTTAPVITRGPITGTDPTSGISETYTLDLAFQDEFDSPLSQYDSTLNEGTWRTWFYYGAQNSQGSRVEGLVSCIFSDVKFNGYQPFSIANSLLTIKADNNPAFPASSTFAFLSGTITTQNSFTQTYGYFECRCRTNPVGVGVWPAFWSNKFTTDSTDANEEIDMMECFANPNSVDATLHKRDQTPFSHVQHMAVNNTSLFHTYGMLWTPTSFYFYVDDVQLGFEANPPIGFHTPHYVICTLQTGTTDNTFVGFPTPAEIPILMDIDFVRVWSLGSTFNNATVNLL